MKRLIPALLAALALGFSSGALAGDRYRGWDGGHRGHGYGHYDHGHGYRSSFNVVLGVPLYGPRYYSPYAYNYNGWYNQPPVIVQQVPVTYVQREAPPAPAPAQSEFWYYCPDTRTYYPYAQTCPSDWLQVVPQTTPR